MNCIVLYFITSRMV